MRMMAVIRIPVDKGNKSLKDGSIQQHIQRVMEQIKPESAYFYLEGSRRTMRAVYECKNSNDMVPAFEPLMLNLDAEIELLPVMNAEELAAGLKALG